MAREELLAGNRGKETPSDWMKETIRQMEYSIRIKMHSREIEIYGFRAEKEGLRRKKPERFW